MFSEQFGSLKALDSCAYSLQTLGDIVYYVQDGLHGVRHYVPVGIPLLGVGNITPDGVDLTNVNYIANEEHDRLKASHVKKGDLLVTITGRLGTAALYQSDKPANLSAHVALCRMKAGHEPLSLKHYLASRFGEASLTKAQIGSTHPHINVRRLKELPLPVPPIEVRKKLADEMEAARESRKKKLRQADELLGGIDEWVMGKLGLTSGSAAPRNVFAIRRGQLQGAMNPERYASVRVQKAIVGTTIAQVCEILTEKISPAKMSPSERWDRIRIDDLPSYPLQIDTISTETGSEIEGSFFLVQENDVLLARLGPTIQNSKFVLCPHLERQTVASSEFLVLRCNKDWSPEVVLWILKTRLFRGIMYSLCRGGTPSRYRLNAEDLAQMSFPGIDGKLQRMITAEVRRRRDEARRLRAEAETEWAAAKKWFEEQLLGGAAVAPHGNNMIDSGQEKGADENADSNRMQRGRLEEQSSAKGKKRRYLESIPKQVHDSMAFEREPVSLQMLKEYLKSLKSTGRPPAS